MTVTVIIAVVLAIVLAPLAVVILRHVRRVRLYRRQAQQRRWIEQQKRLVIQRIRARYQRAAVEAVWHLVTRESGRQGGDHGVGPGARG